MGTKCALTYKCQTLYTDIADYGLCYTHAHTQAHTHTQPGREGLGGHRHITTYGLQHIRPTTLHFVCWNRVKEGLKGKVVGSGGPESPGG